ncbi:MAG TPA: hypothetical protein PKK42_25625, partial [Leptospiraceae bacterium]|nr:hypothetical protein [Leptospiraceae bacterium]
LLLLSLKNDNGLEQSEREGTEGLPNSMFLPKGRNIRQAFDFISLLAFSNILKLIFCGSIY